MHKATPYGNAWKLLHCAVLELAGSRSQTERLCSALQDHLSHIDPSLHLPEGMKEDFTEFWAPMESFECPRAFVYTLDDLEIGQKIDKIVGMYDSICRHSNPF